MYLIFSVHAMAVYLFKQKFVKIIRTSVYIICTSTLQCIIGYSKVKDYNVSTGVWLIAKCQLILLIIIMTYNFRPTYYWPCKLCHLHHQPCHPLSSSHHIIILLLPVLGVLVKLMSCKLRDKVIAVVLVLHLRYACGGFSLILQYQ